MDVDDATSDNSEGQDTRSSRSSSASSSSSSSSSAPSVASTSASKPVVTTNASETCSNAPAKMKHHPRGSGPHSAPWNVDDEPTSWKRLAPRLTVDHVSGSLPREPFSVVVGNWMGHLERLFDETLAAGNGSCVAHDALFVLRGEDAKNEGDMHGFVKRVLENLQMRLALVKASERKSQLVVVRGREQSMVITELLRKVFDLTAVKKKQAKSVADEKMSKYLGKMGLYGTKGKTNVLANRKKKKKAVPPQAPAPAPAPSPARDSTDTSTAKGGEKLLDDLDAMRRMLQVFTQFKPDASACFRFVHVFVDNVGVVVGASLEHTLRAVGNLEALEVFDSAKRSGVSELLMRAGCAEEDVEAVWRYIEATVALLHVGFESGSSSATTVITNSSKPDIARFAEIAGIDLVDLKRCLCSRQVRAGNRSSFIWVALSPEQAHSGVCGLAMALFEALLEFVEAKANHYLSLHAPRASLTHGVTLLESSRDQVEQMSDLERLLVNYANDELVCRTAKAFASVENEQLDRMGFQELFVEMDGNAVTEAFRRKHNGLEDALNEHTTLLNVGSRSLRALGKRLSDVADAYPSIVGVSKAGEHEFSVRHWKGVVKYIYSTMVRRNTQSVRAEAAQLIGTRAQNDLLRQIFERSATYRRTFVAIDDGDRGGRDGVIGKRKRRRDVNTFLKRFVSEVDACTKMVDNMDIHCVYSLRGEGDRRKSLQQFGFGQMSHKNKAGLSRILSVEDLTQGPAQSASEVLKSVGVDKNEYLLSTTHCAMTDTAYKAWLIWHNRRFDRASVRIQRAFRRYIILKALRRERELFREHFSAVTSIQATFRMKHEQRVYKQTQTYTRKIQAWYRGRSAWSRFNTQRSAATRMRRAWKCYTLQRVVRKRVLDCRAVNVQKQIRRWLAQARMIRLKTAIVIIQAYWRQAIVLKRVREKRLNVDAYREALDDGELSCWDGKVVLGSGKGATVGTMILTTRHRVLVLDETGQKWFASEAGSALAWAVVGEDEVYLQPFEVGTFVKIRFKNPRDAVGFVQVIAEEHRPIDCLGLRKPYPLEREKPWMVFGQCPGRFTLKKLTQKRLKKRMSSIRLRIGKSKRDAGEELPVECLIEWQNTALIFRKLRPRRVLFAFRVNHDLDLSFNNGKLRFTSMCPGMTADEVVIECDATSSVMLYEWARARVALRRKEVEVKDSSIELACLNGDTSFTCGRLEDALWWYAKTLKLTEKALNYHTMESDSPVFYKMVHLTKRSRVQALSKRAKCKLRQGAAKGALADAASALAMDDGNVDALWVKGKASLELGDYPGALRAARDALGKRFRHVPFQQLLHEVFLAATQGGTGLRDGALCKRLGIIDIAVRHVDVPFWSAAKYWLSFQEGDEVKELFRFGKNMAYGHSCGQFGFFALDYIDRT